MQSPKESIPGRGEPRRKRRKRKLPGSTKTQMRRGGGPRSDLDRKNQGGKESLEVREDAQDKAT